MYTGARRIARPMPGGRPLELTGDGKSRQMADAFICKVKVQNPAYRQAAILFNDYEKKREKEINC